MKSARTASRLAVRLPLALGALLGGLVARGGDGSAPAPSVAPVPAPAASPAPPDVSPARSVAITIDDLPGVGVHLTLPRLVDVNRRMMQALRQAKAPASVFVNEGKLHVEGETDERTKIIREWLEAGFTVGNHTFSHKGLTATPLKEWEDDVVRGETILKELLGARGGKLVWFRHPFTQTGPTAEIRQQANEFLGKRGYRVAPVTIEYSDWIFAALHEDAAYRPDKEGMDRISDAYLDYFDLMMGWYEGLSKETFDREIPQVLLLHANALNAVALPDLLEHLKDRGYRFITLEEALADKAYESPDGFIGRYGPSWYHRWRLGLNLPDRFKAEPDPPGWILEADAERQKKAQPLPQAPPPVTSPPKVTAPEQTSPPKPMPPR